MGAKVGDAVGAVGAKVVGAAVGEAVGGRVGRCVGSTVGMNVGDPVGAAEATQQVFDGESMNPGRHKHAMSPGARSAQ